MPKIVATVYLALMIAISSFLFLDPDVQEEAILTIGIMGIAYGVVDHALRESDYT